MGFKNSEFSWHIWHTDPKTGMKKWCGQFYGEKDALSWKKRQPRPDEYRITNYGPTRVAAGNRPARPVPSSSGSAQRAMAEARAEADRRLREQVKAQRAKAQQDEARRAKDAAEMADIRQDAAGLIEQHKKDEAADLEAGINR